MQNVLAIVILFFMGCIEDTTDIFRPSDITRPDTPAGLTATATGSMIHLAWNGIDDDGLEGYNIYRAASADSGYVCIASNVTETAYTDSTGLVPETVYYYTVTARDVAGNQSYPSNVVSASLSVVATHTLTMQVNNTLWGGTSPQTGDHTYTEGTVVTIAATPADGYRFVNWSGPVANTEAAQTTVTMTGDITVTANFEEIPANMFVLTMDMNDTDGGVTIPSAGTHTYAADTVVTVTAVPAGGYRFVNWSGPVTDADSSTTTVTMTGNITVTANFEKVDYTLTIDLYREGWGTTSPGTGPHTYQAFTEVQLTATPERHHLDRHRTERDGNRNFRRDSA